MSGAKVRRLYSRQSLGRAPNGGVHNALCCPFKAWPWRQRQCNLRLRPVESHLRVKMISCQWIKWQMESDVLYKMVLEEILLLLWRKVVFRFDRVVNTVQSTVLDLSGTSWCCSITKQFQFSWTLTQQSLGSSRPSIFLPKYFHLVLELSNQSTSDFAWESHNTQHLFLVTGTASFCMPRNHITKKCRFFWLYVNPTTGIYCSRPSTRYSLANYPITEHFQMWLNKFWHSFWSGWVKNSKGVSVSTWAHKIRELLLVHRISEVLTEREKTVSYSFLQQREEKILSTINSRHFPPIHPEEVHLRRPPRCDQPIFSFVFHLLPRHRRVPLSKRRCCNEAKLLLINEKASSSVATVRSDASEPRATIHAWDPANFASSHSVTAAWHIVSPGHGRCRLTCKQAFSAMHLNLQRRCSVCSTLSLAGCRKPIVSAGLRTFPCSASFDPLLMWKSTSDWHKELNNAERTRGKVWLAEIRERDPKTWHRRQEGEGKVLRKCWWNISVAAAIPFEFILPFGESEFNTRCFFFIMHAVCCLPAGCEFVMNALLLCFISLPIKVV